MALFGFLKKQADEPMQLQPPRPPSGSSPLSPVSLSNQPVGRIDIPSSPPNRTAALQSLPPLPPVSSPKPLGLPPIPPANVPPAMPSLGALPKLETPSLPPLSSRPAVTSDVKPLPPLPSLAPKPQPVSLPTLAPKPQPVSLPPLLRPASATPPAPAFSSQSKPSLGAAFDLKPVEPKLPPLASVPKISVNENKPVDPFAMPSVSAEKGPIHVDGTRAPEPLKRENSRLAAVLDQLATDEFDLPKLSPLSPQPLAAPAFEPQMGRVSSPYNFKRGRSFISLQQFEEAAISMQGTDQHIHNLQVHNEKLGIIETHTKNELETLVTVFEILQRHLMAMDDKLFITQGEY